MADVFGKSTSPRKQMGMGVATDSLGKPSTYPGSGDSATRNPDMAMRSGEQGDGNHLKDHERGIGQPIEHAKGYLPAQAAPRHGPHHEREMGFDRGGKV